MGLGRPDERAAGVPEHGRPARPQRAWWRRPSRHVERHRTLARHEREPEQVDGEGRPASGRGARLVDHHVAEVRCGAGTRRRRPRAASSCSGDRARPSLSVNSAFRTGALLAHAAAPRRDARQVAADDRLAVRGLEVLRARREVAHRQVPSRTPTGSSRTRTSRPRIARRWSGRAPGSRPSRACAVPAPARWPAAARRAARICRRRCRDSGGPGAPAPAPASTATPATRARRSGRRSHQAEDRHVAQHAPRHRDLRVERRRRGRTGRARAARRRRVAPMRIRRRLPAGAPPRQRRSPAARPATASRPPPGNASPRPRPRDHRASHRRRPTARGSGWA